LDGHIRIAHQFGSTILEMRFDLSTTRGSQTASFSLLHILQDIPLAHPPLWNLDDDAFFMILGKRKPIV
jgi:hypothetical protein